MALLASTMVLQSLLEKEHGYGRDCLACDEELDDSKDSCVDQVVFEELEKLRPAKKPKAKLKTLPAHLKYVFLEEDETKPPESKTPKGTSVINLFTTACNKHSLISARE